MRTKSMQHRLVDLFEEACKEWPTCHIPSGRSIENVMSLVKHGANEPYISFTTDGGVSCKWQIGPRYVEATFKDDKVTVLATHPDGIGCMQTDMDNFASDLIRLGAWNIVQP